MAEKCDLTVLQASKGLIVSVFQSQKGNMDLAHTTVVCSWVFTFVASIATFLYTIRLIILVRRGSLGFGVDDVMLYLAYFFALTLVAQNTWAIVRDGQDDHITRLTSPQLASVAKISFK